MNIIDRKEGKALFSKEYNYIYRKSDGFFMRWGKTRDDDPQFSPYGPEILDLEISSGKCNGKCEFCYKDNGADVNTHHMSLDEFKTIFHKMPQALTQIAFGICDISSNPDFFPMMEYARKNGIVPNYTCNGLEVTQEVVQQTAKICGAVAVSLVNKKKSYEAILEFIKAGMNQVNLHYMFSEETYDEAFNVVDEIAKDLKPKGFNAIVFLQYKPKGRNTESFHPVLNLEKYTKLINYCNEKNVKYGFDSCSAPIFLSSGQDKFLDDFVEPCESGLFSSYINCHGKFFVCSFAEGEDKWKEGIDVLQCDNFLDDVWYHPRLVKWRDRLLDNKRNCPIYDLSMEKIK